MKKGLALIMAVVVLLTMSLTVFAALSPVSVGEWKVTFGSYASGQFKLGTYKINDDGTITCTKAKYSKYEFLGWRITGKHEIVSKTYTTAISGSLIVNYSAALKEDVITVRPLGDIKIVELYDCPAAGAEDDNPTSPQTGNNLLILGPVVLLALSVAFVANIAKKRLA